MVVGWNSIRSLAAAGLASCLVITTAGRALAGPALVFDTMDGTVFYSEDVDDAWHPASLTKVMTAYLTFEALKNGKITLETKLPMSELAHSQPPTKIGLPIGAEIDVNLALQALIIKSANDVAMLLAEGIGGSQESFVERMNATAKRLGMTRTTFVNPNGLPADEQVTTARDLGRLTRAVLRDFPQYAAMWSLAEMRVGRRVIRNHNQLLKAYSGTDGMKTGFTCDSGYNVIATATRDGHKLAAIVLGEPTGGSRSLRAANLLEHGFQYRGWDGVLKPTTLDTLPTAPDAQLAAISVRNFVPGLACGGRNPGSVAHRVRRKPIVTAQAKTDAAKASQTSAAASSLGKVDQIKPPTAEPPGKTAAVPSKTGARSNP